MERKWRCEKGSTHNGVEGMAGKRRRHLPQMMGLVESGIEQRKVQGAVDPVNAGVGEEEKEDC